jgi:hypothetical protein
MASLDEEAWYLEASAVPVGWNSAAVAFRVVPLFAGALPFWIAPGAMIIYSLEIYVYSGVDSGVDIGGSVPLLFGMMREAARKAEDHNGERILWSSFFGAVCSLQLRIGERYHGATASAFH